jgi:hypothetical protein
MRIVARVKQHVKRDQRLIKIFFIKYLICIPDYVISLVSKNVIALKWRYKFSFENHQGLERSKANPMSNLIVCITFHFSFDRLKYLEKVTSSLDSLANNVKLIIVTNTDNSFDLEIMQTYVKTKLFTITVSPNLAHPFLLAEEHINIFRNQFEADDSLSHFMYLEDDIYVNINNINYWLTAREDLRKFGLIPSFLRYEIPEGKSEIKSTDVIRSESLKSIPKIKLNSQYWYINMNNPYQGMYLLDRELAKLYLFGRHKLDKRYKKWGTRERAASGLTFVNVPKSFFSRNLVGFCLNNFCIDSNALIHHLPNNYANNSKTAFGKLKVSELIIYSKSVIK